MEEYKEVIEEFLKKIEKLDMSRDFDNMSERDLYLFDVVRACRNKLADTYNSIGDETWVLPTMEWK